jgi:hypothetical protein
VDGSGAGLEEEDGASGGTGGAEPRTISRRITGFHAPDLKLAICLGSGMTYDEIAGFVPCARSNIAYRLEANKAFIQEWREFAERVAQFLASRQEEVTAANYLKRQERNLLKAEKVLDRILDRVADDSKKVDFQELQLAVKVALSREDRLFGTPKQKIETEATDTKVLEIGPAFMALIEKTEERARQRLLQSGDEIVVEVIPSDPED